MNGSLSGDIKVLIKLRMSTAVDISALRVNHDEGVRQSVSISNVVGKHKK